MAFVVCCSDDGGNLACLSRRVNMFELSSRKRIWSVLPFSHASQAAFSPDGKILVLKNTSGRILALDSATGNVMYDYKNQNEGEGSEVLFSPEGDRLIDASWKGVITVRKLLERTIVTQQSVPGEMIVRISHDSIRRTWLFEHHPVVRPGENWPLPPYLTIEKWPIGEHTAKVISLDLDMIASATLSPDASKICYVCRRRSLGSWIKVAKAANGETLARSEEIKTGGTGSELAWSSDGKYIGSVQKQRFVFYNASDLSVIGEVPCTYPSSICFSPIKDEVVLGSWKASVLMGLDAITAGELKMP